MRVAIIGAGPAGTQLAWRLRRDGAEVLLFDARKEPWEKPCGGGVTTKALREFAFLRSGAPQKLIEDVRVISVGGNEVRLSPKSEFAIFSRADLDRMMRSRATDSGAIFINARVARISRTTNCWTLITQDGVSFAADFLVGADGATSKTRRHLGFDFGPRDFIYALGWHIRNSALANSRVDIKYLSETMGYIWAFPRTDHLSFGIATKYQERRPLWLKEQLVAFIAGEYPDLALEIANAGYRSTGSAEFYGAMIPALEPDTWNKLRVSDANNAWALVGDAAGFVDPLTGEGIYYAIKSADLLADSLAGPGFDYESRWRDEFGEELHRASQLARRFYLGSVAGKPVTDRMVQFARYHKGIRNTLNDLIAGEQGYLDLKPRLLRSSMKII